MKFSYKVSEKEYLQGYRLRVKLGSKSRTFKLIMFWVFILVCLLLLWSVVQRSSKVSTESDYTEPVPT